MRTISLARANLSSTSGTGLARPPFVARRVAADLAVGVGPQQRRHAEQLEVVERLQVGAVDHGGALRLQADGDARAGQLRRRGDERDVGGAADAHDAVADALLLDARADLAQHLLVRDAADRLAQRAAEGGPDGDDDLVDGRAPRRESPSSRRSAGPSAASTRPTPAGSTSCGRACSSAQRVALEHVARARAAVVVGVVDGRVHRPGGVDHRGGLQVVGRDALTLHADDALGHLAEAAAIERERHVGRRDPLGQHAIGRQHVLGAIAVGQVVAGVAERRRGDLLVGHGRKPELVEDGLDRMSGTLAHGQHGVLAGGFDAAVHLPVALQRHPLVEVVGV